METAAIHADPSSAGQVDSAAGSLPLCAARNSGSSKIGLRHTPGNVAARAAPRLGRIATRRKPSRAGWIFQFGADTENLARASLGESKLGIPSVGRSDVPGMAG